MTPNQQTANRRTRLAAITAGAALALGALGVAASEQRDATLMSDDPTTTIAPAPPMTTGSTVTETGAPPSPQIPVATPEITTTPSSAAP